MNPELEIAERIEHYESLVAKDVKSKIAMYEFALTLNTLFDAVNNIHIVERVYPGIGRWVRMEFYITLPKL